MGGGAWPFLVGGVICLVNSDNERDLNLLNSDRDNSVEARMMTDRAYLIACVMEKS